jgi:hypothetical protein
MRMIQHVSERFTSGHGVGVVRRDGAADPGGHEHRWHDRSHAMLVLWYHGNDTVRLADTNTYGFARGHPGWARFGD